MTIGDRVTLPDGRRGEVAIALERPGRPTLYVVATDDGEAVRWTPYTLRFMAVKDTPSPCP